NVEIDPLAVLTRLPGAAAQDDDLRLHQDAIGNHHRIPVARFDGSLPPANLFHLTFLLIDAQPIADVDGVFHLQSEAAHDVAECVLERKADDGGDDRRGRDDAGDV